jgi:lipid-A-disaccharide synthase
MEKPRQPGGRKTIMLLPGSRGSKSPPAAGYFGDAVQEFAQRNGDMRFVLPTVPRREEALVREIIGTGRSSRRSSGSDAKWQAFAEADAAMAASGTVILELALAGRPCVSAYKTDWIIKLMTGRIKIWTAAIPNLIADYAVVPEYINEVVRGAALSRWMEKLSTDTCRAAP